MRQRLLGCVAESGWRDAEMLRRLALMLERELPGLEAFVIDDLASRKREFIRSASLVNIRARLGGSTIARSRPACISQAIGAAPVSDWICIYLSSGQRTMHVERK
jgi:hypothetical protein